MDDTVLANLTSEERARSAVYIDDTPEPPGQVTIAGRQIGVGHSYFVAFIDRNPGANWMHPCRYLVINPADRQVISIDGNRPPAFGTLPRTWRLIGRSAGVEDWQLLKITGRSAHL